MRPIPLIRPCILALPVLVAGCLPVAVPNSAPNDAAMVATRARPSTPTQVIVSAARIRISGPESFCIDTPSSEPDPPGAFIVLRHCADLAGATQGVLSPDPAVMTVAISSIDNARPAVAGVEEAVSAFFASEEGRRAISRDQTAQTVTILKTQTEPGVVYLQVRDTSSGKASGLANDYWRAVFDVKSRIATVTVAGFSEKPLSYDHGRRLIRALVSRIRSENADAPAKIDTTQGIFKGFAKRNAKL